MKRLLCALAGFSLACGGSPASPSKTPLSQSVETPSYLFQFSQGDHIDSAWQESYHAWAVQALQVSVPRRITYNKYVSHDHMGQLTGSYTTNAYADRSAFAIHTLWPIDNHEIIHLFGSTFGDPVALWSEGMAVAFTVNAPAGDFVAKWNGTPVHVRARPEPGWLKVRHATRNLSGGMFEEDCEIWDSAGRLVAQSRQLALVPR